MERKNTTTRVNSSLNTETGGGTEPRRAAVQQDNTAVIETQTNLIIKKSKGATAVSPINKEFILFKKRASENTDWMI